MTVASIRHRVGVGPRIGETHLLSRHRVGQPKYHALGRPYPGEEFALAKEETLEVLAHLVRSCGLQVQMGG